MSVDASDITSFAQQFIGTPYQWGGNDPTKGVDCSGLVQQVFSHFGISLPRTTYDQVNAGSPVGLKGLRPGDLVFFDTDGKGNPSHVGIYIGGGKMIHAPRPGKGVEVTDMTQGYYMSKFLGGRRIDGTRAVGAKVSDLEETPKLSPEEMAANYGWSYAFLNSNPELKKKFNQAVAEGWTADKFQAEVRDTKWWKENSDSMRQAKILKATDPATYQAQLNAATIQVKQLAAEMGAPLTAATLKKAASDMLQYGMDEGQLRYALGKYVDFTKKGTMVGEAGMHEYTMKQYAAQMGVSVTDQALKNQAQLVVRKLATTQDFEDQIKQQAISAYPAYQQQIEAGETVQDLASPYVQMAAQELETPYQDFNVDDPLIKSAMNGLDKSGKPTGMSLTDFQTRLKNDPRWNQTKNAQDDVMSTGITVLKDMGLMPNKG